MLFGPFIYASTFSCTFPKMPFPLVLNQTTVFAWRPCGSSFLGCEGVKTRQLLWFCPTVGGQACPCCDGRRSWRWQQCEPVGMAARGCASEKVWGFYSHSSLPHHHRWPQTAKHHHRFSLMVRHLRNDKSSFGKCQNHRIWMDFIHRCRREKALKVRTEWVNPILPPNPIHCHFPPLIGVFFSRKPNSLKFRTNVRLQHRRTVPPPTHGRSGHGHNGRPFRVISFRPSP